MDEIYIDLYQELKSISIGIIFETWIVIRWQR